MCDDESKKPDLLTLEDARSLSNKSTVEMYSKYINPGVGKFLNMLGFADRLPVKAEGTTIYLKDGAQVLDLTAGVSVLNTGHNHPRILRARQAWAEEKQMEVWKLFPSPYQSVLARNLAALFPEDLKMVFFCNSGAEANEGALKMAEKVAGPGRDVIVYTDISFHGKTHATLSVSGSESHQNQYFKLLPGCVSIPYGDAEAFEQVLKANIIKNNKTRVAAFILEAIRSEGVVLPPPGYLKMVRKLCDEYNVCLIMDEVFTGFGRTGKMFAFEHFDVVPDICTFAKSFGGGKATFAAYVAREKLYKKAYGKMSEATLHSTTFSGFGEEVLAAIETLHILYDEGLITNARVRGQYLLERMKEVKAKFPGIITDVRGIGLLTTIRFENMATRIAKAVPGVPEDLVIKLTTGGIMTELYEKYNILTFTPPHDFQSLLITPPLMITAAEVDRFCDALEKVLRTGLVKHATRYIMRLSKMA